jgi:hypothetical protein
MRWLLSEYLPTTLFSLKTSNATSAAAKSLICPTPYAVKLALLDAAIRTLGGAEGEALFPTILHLKVAVALPEYIAVSNCFIKIQSEPKNKKESPDPLIPTVTFREYVYFAGTLRLALGSNHEDENLSQLPIQINHFGKRGCFFQLRDAPHWMDELPVEYVELTRRLGAGDGFAAGGLIQMMDDIAPNAKFENINTFDSAKAARDQPSIVLPYRRFKSSKGYTCYQRIEVK